MRGPAVLLALAFLLTAGLPGAAEAQSVTGVSIDNSNGPGRRQHLRGRRHHCGASQLYSGVDLTVVTGGTPRLPLQIGDATRYAAYSDADSRFATLIFKYTVQAGDNDIDGIGVPGPIDLNGGSIEATITATLADQRRRPGPRQPRDHERREPQGLHAEADDRDLDHRRDRHRGR